MSDIINPQVVRFCNEKVRTTSDRIISAIRTMRQFVSDYDADGIGPLVAGDQTLSQSTIADNSDQDGRTRLLGYDVDNFKGKVVALLALLDSDPTIEPVLTKPSVNSQPMF